MTNNRFIFTAIILIMSIVVVGCDSSEPVKIGFIGGLSGRVADLGTGGRNGALMAVEDFNRSGGVKGRPVQLLIRDDEQNKDKLEAAINSLAEEKVQIIIGPMTSSMAMVALPKLEPHGILLISPTVTTPALTGVNDLFFRVSSDSNAYAKFSAKYLVKKTPQLRISATYDLANKAYTESWLQVFENELTKLGGQVAAKISFTSGADTNHKSVIEQMLASSPDALLFVSNAVDTARFSQETRLKNKKVQLAAVEWSATEALLELGGRAIEGMTLSSFFNRDSSLPVYQSFKRTYKEKFDREPGFAATASYDATRTSLIALNQMKTGSLRDFLIRQKAFPGLQQPVIFDTFGDAQRDIYLSRIENGRYVTQ